jgi:hypothetical protein
LTGADSPRRIGRSIFAMLVGALTGILLSIGTDFVLHRTGVFRPVGQPMSDTLFVLAAAYRTVYSVLGSYLVACLAPNRPMWHAMFLGFIGLAASSVGTVVTWNAGPAFGPHWYPLSLVVLALPTAWFGAWLFLLRSKTG